MRKNVNRLLAILLASTLLTVIAFGALAAQQIVSGTLQNDFNLTKETNTWTLTINDNNGSGNVYALEYEKKALVAQPPQQPEYESNRFEGWSTDRR